MRAVRAKRLRRESAQEAPQGSKLTRDWDHGGMLFWKGTRRVYRDKKRGIVRRVVSAQKSLVKDLISFARSPLKRGTN